MLERAPIGTFGGGISLGFCPTPALRKSLCPTGEARAPQLSAPWTVLQGIHDKQCRTQARQFLANMKQAEVIAVPGDDHGEGDFHTWERQFAGAFQRLGARTRGLPPVSAAELKDLPLIEVHSAKTSDTLAVLISGDGGWAGIDKELAAALSKQGLSVVGLDSLRYFWKPRTPEGTAADMDRLLRHYLSAWKKRSVLLIGFSQGADVMPFIVNRLPATTRERLRMVALLSLSETAVFEFHLQNWIGAAKNTIPVTPELLRMKGVRGLCVYGADETDSLCTKPAAKSLQVVKVNGGHHFDGNYAKLAALLLSHMR
jgi:type IV secretory pathway VirJ component